MKKENTHLPTRTGWLGWIPTCTTDFTACQGGAEVTRASLPLPCPSLLTLTPCCKLHSLITHINISDRPSSFPTQLCWVCSTQATRLCLQRLLKKLKTVASFTLPSTGVPFWGCLLLSCCPHSCPGPASLTSCPGPPSLTMAWTGLH